MRRKFRHQSVEEVLDLILSQNVAQPVDHGQCGELSLLIPAQASNVKLEKTDQTRYNSTMRKAVSNTYLCFRHPRKFRPCSDWKRFSR